MKTLVGLVALVAVLGVGVAAYDYTVGGVGILPGSWTCCEAPSGCCQEGACLTTCEGSVTECAGCPSQSASDEPACCASASKTKATCPLSAATPAETTDK